MKFAQIVLNLPIEGPFDYSIPQELADKIKVGQRVLVNFGPRRLVGYIVGFSDKSRIANIKPIQGIIEPEPFINEEILKLTRWLADYYFCSWGEAIEATVPGILRKGKTAIRTKLEPEEKNTKTSFHLMPTLEQNKAIKAIKDTLIKNKYETFLLYGITGSGKTEVYLQTIAQALNLGKSSIVLVPEISLTPQTVEWFKARFGPEVAVWHSRLKGSERYIQWKKIKEGKARIVVGARSAVFSPVKNLGLIIIDEEHENTYKQEDVPRYNTQEVATQRVLLNNAVLILGSATPSLESYYNVVTKKYKLIRLTERIKKRDLPKVEIIDMRREFKGPRGKTVLFSRILEERIRYALSQKEQVILFLNRRGFSTFISCPKCGFTLRCRHCEVSLVYHYASQKLICHYCNYSVEPPQICPKCRGNYLRYFGLGTEKIESEAHRLFPQARIARLDTDITAKRGMENQILNDFKNRKIDILIGTQMIAKGLDFPLVTLVGVISADTALNLPDFRASERTFNLLTQVAGRAGRGKSPGLVLVQTYNPTHYAVFKSRTHDYLGFYKKEIKFRKELKLPPFTHITKLTIRSKNSELASETANKLVKLVKEGLPNKISVVGPAPAVIAKVRGFFCWDVMLKAKQSEAITTFLKARLKKFKKSSKIKLTVDVDPR